MVRFNDKKQATELASDDILIMTDVSDSSVDKKVSMGQMANYVSGLVDALPEQAGHGGQYLTTDGTEASWVDVDALPEQTGNKGKYLYTDGETAVWRTGYHPPLLSSIWADHILNDIQWLRGDTFSWQSGKVYTGAYNKLLDEYNALKTNLYAWQDTDGNLIYTKTNTPVVGTEVYGSAILHLLGTTTAVASDTTTITYSDIVYTRTAVSDKSDVIFTTDDQGVYCVRTASDFKIAPSTQEDTILSLYNSTGVAWYYILDTTNTQFKLPRTKWGMVGLRDNVENTVDAGTTGANIKATQMYLYFYVGDYTQEAIEQTAGVTTETLNAKADTDLGNLSTVGQAKLDFCFDSINRLYDGVDLTTKFASEIANYSDAWAWIKNRITNGNYTGINVGDYIPFTLSAGTAGDYTIAAQSMKAQIAGIDTYKNCCDTEVGHHIDFISKELIDTPIKWNPTDNNNGTSANNEPWLASAMYAVLNGVNNYSTSAYGSQAHGANASEKGIYQLLPQALRNQIIQKRNVIDTRYSASAYLTYSTNWNWKDMGLLWLPNEIEVYGTQIRSNLGYAQGYWNPEANIGVAYPLFLGQGRNRVKRKSNNGRYTWWLSSATANYSAHVCSVGGYGDAGNGVAADATIYCPVCFRIG